MPTASLTPIRPFQHQPELRALSMLSSVPPVCMTVEAVDEAFEPHLHRGEFAVVDMSDRRPDHGELFVIAWETPLRITGHIFRLCVVARSTSGHWHVKHELPTGEREMGGLSEGPFSTDGLASKLVGRVVGVFVPKVGAEQEAAR